MRKIVGVGLGAVLLALLVAAPVSAQDSNEDLKREIEALKKGQQDIQKQLQELKKLIQSRPAAPARRAGPDVKGKVFNLGTKAKGVETAKLTLIEFTDYQ